MKCLVRKYENTLEKIANQKAVGLVVKPRIPVTSGVTSNGMMNPTENKTKSNKPLKLIAKRTATIAIQKEEILTNLKGVMLIGEKTGVKKS